MVEKMDDFISLPHDPLILRGASLDFQTQIGFYGTLLQVLHQQGYTVEERSLLFVRLSNPSRGQTRIHGGLNQDCRKKPCSVCHADDCLDEESNGDTTIETHGLPGGDK